MNKKLAIWAGFFLAALVVLVAVSASAEFVYAQSNEEVWEDPINLSNSGASSNPLLVVDAVNRVHVIWSDEFEGIMYVQKNENGWTEPRQTAFYFPAGLDNIKMLAGKNGRVHALWTDDLNQTLYYSQVDDGNFADLNAWSIPLQIGNADVSQFEMTLDNNGRLHVLFAKVEDDDNGPAGIYYRFADPPSYGFRSPILLYESLYFRGLTPLQIVMDIRTGVSGQVYASWDLAPLERVYFARSFNSGLDWGEPVLVDNRLEQDSLEATGPRWMQLLAFENSVMRFWQAGHADSTCSQYFQLSTDGGETWSEADLLAKDLTGCPNGNQFLIGENNEVIALSNRPIGIFLQAWDGLKWSTPQLQTPLTTFTNPENFRQVSLGCRRAAFDHNNTLYFIGCDTAGGEDIWAISRPLGSVESWFPTPTPTIPWSDPNVITANRNEISNPEIAADMGGRLHAFWNQVDQDAVFYSRWEGDEQGANLAWSNIVTVVNAPGGMAEQPAAVVDRNDRMHLVWGGGSTGGIGYSWVDTNAAIFAEEWATPVLLPAPRNGGTSPQIVRDSAGSLYVIYAITINERRGIYLTRSNDEGVTWSPYYTIFDAELANWDMVDKPSFAVTADGKVHALWTRFSLSADKGPLPTELHYASSTDGGETWSDTELVSNRPTYSSQIQSIGQVSLQRVWTDGSSEDLTTWYQVSHDDGETWSETNRVSEYGEENPLFSMSLDQGGVSHLLQVRRGIISETGVSPYVLQHLAWNGQNWSLIENLELGPLEVTGLASAVGARGNLGVLYVYQVLPQNNPQPQENLLFLNRYLELNIVVATPEPTSTPEAEALLGLTPTLEPTHTPTIAFSTTEDSGPLDALGQYGGLLIGIIPAALIIFLVLSIGRRRRP